jgi:hypothetical protein
MAVTLETIMAAVVDTIETQTGADAVPHVFGRKHMHDHVVCPRIIWARGESDSFSAARSYGPTQAYPSNARSLFTVTTSVEIHIWAQSEEQFEVLRQNEIAALHRLLHGSYNVTGGRVVDADDAILSLGYVYVMTVQIQQPIMDALTPTATIVSTAADTITGAPASEGFGHEVILEFGGNVEEHCGHLLSTV